MTPARMFWRHREQKMVLCAAILLFATTVFAATGDFERGLNQYNAGAFEKAVTAFEAAVADGPKSAESNFYLGLSLYKLNRYAAAGAAFEQTVAIDPKNGAALLFRGLSHQADGAYKKAVPYFRKAAEADADFEQLAYYNIGISLFRAGDRGAAKAALTRAIASDPKSDTAGDAEKFLANIETIGEKNVRNWTASASAGWQYDDNVTTDEIDQTTNISDTAFVFDASASYQLLPDGPVGLEIGYDFFQSLYDDRDESDLQLHGVSLVLEKEIGDFDAALTYNYTRALLGRDDFLGLQSVTPSLGYAVTPEWYVNLVVNAQDKNFIDIDERDSRVYSAGMNIFWLFMDGKANVSVGYRAEDENTNGPEFDYLGHFVFVAIKIPVPGTALARWNPQATLGWAYYDKEYDNVTVSIAARRRDRRTTLSLGLTADITKRLQAKLSYEKIEAVSNLGVADFDENVATFSIGVKF